MKKQEFEILKKQDKAYTLADGKLVEKLGELVAQSVGTKKDYKQQIAELQKKQAQLANEMEEKTTVIEIQERAIENKRQENNKERLQLIEEFLKKHFISNDMMEKLLEAETGKGWVISQARESKRHYHDYVNKRVYKVYCVDLFIASADSKMYKKLKDANIPKPVSHLSKAVICGFNHDYLLQLEQEGMIQQILHKEYYDYRINDRHDKMNWMEIYLTEKGIYGEPVNKGFISNPKLIELIVKAIDNQYFNANEEEKAQD